MAASLLFDEETTEDVQREAASKQLLTVAGKQIWQHVRKGKSVYLHVHVVSVGNDKDTEDSGALSLSTSESSSSSSLVLASVGDVTRSLHGAVELVKFEPSGSDRMKRWLLQDFGLGHWSGQPSSADEATKAKLAENAAKQKAAAAAKLTAAAQAIISGGSTGSKADNLVPKWKPEVAVRLVVDHGEYPSAIGGGFSTAASDAGARAAEAGLRSLMGRTLRMKKSNSQMVSQISGCLWACQSVN
jgi:hypothetical protein